MKSNVEKVGSLTRKLNIEIPAEVVKSAFEKMFKGIQKQANIKGFRPGKAPLATVKSLYADRVKQDVVQELVQKHYFDAVQEHKLEPVNYPEFEFDAPTEDKNFSFSAHIEIRPEINLKKYEGLEVEKEKFEVDQKQIDQVLENIRAARATLVDVLESRPVRKGDVAVIDFVGTIDGKPLDGGTGTDHHLDIGANQFIEGFEDGVEGMKIGDKKTLNLKFPTPYHSADLAGKAVEFQVTLKGMKKKDLPELNDEFVATMMGQATGNEKHTVESLKKTILEDLEQSEKKRIDSDFKNRLLKKLVSSNPVDVPPSMLAEQKNLLVEDMKKKMMDQGMSDADFAAYTDKWNADFATTAAEMIQSGFLIDAIANKHDLRWTKEDLDNKYKEYAQQTGIDEQRIREFYGQQEQSQRLTYTITEDKVVNFLTKAAKVTEVSKDKLKK